MEWLKNRPRRNRKSESIRSLVAETTLESRNLIYPVFLLPGEKKEIPIASMEGQSRLSLDLLKRKAEVALERGVNAFAIFPCVPESNKDHTASLSWHSDNFYLKAISALKKEFPELTIVTDVAMDPYSSDGHDGLFEDDEIKNDETLELLGKMAIAQAQAGADVLGPSDMMDGRVGYLRQALDINGFKNVSIMAYTAKYASAFYGPFRDALDSAPKKGDKKTYQMDFRNAVEAEREAALDISEGADFLMVKPALAYLDIIYRLKKASHVPIAAYNVSGEYAMIKAAARAGFLNEKQAMLESVTAIKRAGADIILTYWALDLAEALT